MSTRISLTMKLEMLCHDQIVKHNEASPKLVGRPRVHFIVDERSENGKGQVAKKTKTRLQSKPARVSNTSNQHGCRLQPKAKGPRHVKKVTNRGRLIKCSCCQMTKPEEKYSWKQLKQSNQRCQRCEHKGIFQHIFGKTATITTIQVSDGNQQFLVTAHCPEVPPSGEFPAELILDKYSRADWALPEKCSNSMWSTVPLWLLGDQTIRFINDLKKSKKAAYTFFKIPSGQEGRFVIPFDQPPIVEHSKNHNIKGVYCKYHIGSEKIAWLQPMEHLVA